MCQDCVTAWEGPHGFVESSQWPYGIGVTVSVFQWTAFPLVYPEQSLSWGLNSGRFVPQAQVLTIALSSTRQLEFFASQRWAVQTIAT